MTASTMISVAVGLILFSTTLVSPSEGKAAYRAMLPNPNAAADSGMKCRPLGHDSCTPGATRNQFALDFRAAGYNYTVEFCQKDSDGDGVSNGAELGDPCCVFKQNGTPPARSMDLSHPGEPGSIPVDPKNRQCNAPGPATTPTGNENSIAQAPVNSTRNETASSVTPSASASPSAPEPTPSESPSAAPSIFLLQSASPDPSLSVGASPSASFSPEPSTSVSATPSAAISVSPVPSVATADAVFVSPAPVDTPEVPRTAAAVTVAPTPPAAVDQPDVAVTVAPTPPAAVDQPVTPGVAAATESTVTATESSAEPAAGTAADTTPIEPASEATDSTTDATATDPVTDGTVSADEPSSLGSPNAPVAVQSPFPAENATVSAEPQGSQAACFPGAATVTLYGGENVRMDSLKVGDKVLVGKDNTYSEVIMFTHALSSVVNKFISISTSAEVDGDLRTLTLTAGHYLYVNNKLVSADSVNIGDQLEGSDGSARKVVKLQLVRKSGLYNPQTAHGDIIVNDIRASTYTNTIPSVAAHAMLAPVRAAFEWAGFSTNALEQGVF